MRVTDPSEGTDVRSMMGALSLNQVSGVTTPMDFQSSGALGRGNVGVIAQGGGAIPPFGPVNPQDTQLIGRDLEGMTLPAGSTIEENGKKVTISWPATMEEVDKFTGQKSSKKGTATASSTDPEVIKKVEAAKDRAAKDKPSGSFGGYKISTDSDGNLVDCRTVTKV